MIHSFPPVADKQARILILGSMPGERSLRQVQYYAHPQNAFWYIMGELFDAGLELAYEQRCRRLKDAGLAVWDVLQSCRREGSLDAAIDSQSMIPNEFYAFFEAHSRVSQVFFNGGKAEDVFRRRVLPDLPEAQRERLSFERLPSTSPAHASLSRVEKLSQWRSILKAL